MATTPPSMNGPSFLDRPEKAAAAESRSNSDKPSAQPAATKSSRRGLWISLAVAVLVLGVAGGLLWLRHRHHAGTHETAKAEKPVARTEVHLPLEPFVVNLADAGGHSYARIGMTVLLSTPAPQKSKAAAEGAPAEEWGDMVRDQVITVLNQESSADLLAADGKENLKQKIRAAIAIKQPQLQVIDIYFTQFLIQP